MASAVVLALAITSFSATAAAASAPAPTFTYYPTLTQGNPGNGGTSAPRSIATGSDGALWFTQENADSIGRVGPAGTMTDYPVSVVAGPSSRLVDIAAGPDGALWFTDFGTGEIGRITTAGVITEFPIPTRGSEPIGIALGPDGAMWFTETRGNKIGRIDADGNVTEYPIPTQYAGAGEMTAGPDGAMWFVEESGAIGRVTTSGDITEYPVANGNSDLIAVTTGPDDAVWFTSTDQNGGISFVGRIDPATDAITTYPLPDDGQGDNAYPAGIVTGPDGALWMTLQTLDEIGRMTTDGQLTVYPLSSSPNGQRPQPWGITEGPDSALWFTEGGGSAIGRIGWGSSPPVFTSAASASVGMRTALDVPVTTTSSPAATLTESGTLPAGVTFVDHGDGTGYLAGDAATGTSGTYPITFSADNGSGAPTTQAFSLTVTSAASAPTFTSTDSATEAFGAAFSVTISTDGYPAPKLARSGPLPAGVKFIDNGNGTATISGTAGGAASGPYPLTLTAKNKTGSVTQSFVLTVTKAPTFKTVAAHALVATTGAAYSLTTLANGYTTPAVTESGALPPGLTFLDNGDGTSSITGTPSATAGGSYAITENATNPYGSANLSLTIKVEQAPAVTSAPTATATIGAAFSDQVTTTGYPAPKLSSTGTLPQGIKFTPATATFSGTAKKGTAGSYPLTLTATNVAGTVTQNLVLKVQ